MGKDTSQENTPPSSTIIPTINGTICERCGQPAICNGLGVISYDVPVDDPKFGKLFRCPNNRVEDDYERQERLGRLSNLGAFADKNFSSFQLDRPDLDMYQRLSLEEAFDAAQQFAARPDGWLLLRGSYGCGKTHLAAAIGNERLRQGDMVLFITAPDLLDHLRSTYGPTSEIGYDEMFDRIRSSQLLILDDLGAENPSQWAGEKLFQLLNYRYNHRLPTVITTNVDLERIEGRVRSRILDRNLIQEFQIKVPDYRSPNAAPENPLTKIVGRHTMKFDNFDTHTGVTGDQEKTLQEALNRAKQFADEPKGWLVLLGPYGCGKTHLAAAIANVRIEQRDKVIFTTVTDLMDYLRLTFNTNSTASLQQHLDAVLNVSVLVLDDLNTDNLSAWAREKLFQIIEYRYVGLFPTVITTAKQLDNLDERIVTRLIDARRCKLIAITAPAYAQRMQRPRW